MAEPLKLEPRAPFEGLTMVPMPKLELELDSELPTDRAPEQAALSARARAATLAEGEVWCDSEAPTGVAAERPVLPRPPRAPQV